MKLKYLLLLGLLLPLYAYSETASWAIPKLYQDYAYLRNTYLTSNEIDLKTSIFFNATHSGIQGQKFLLNEQLSNIKIAMDKKWSDAIVLRTLLIYNTLPTPINPGLYFEHAYLQLFQPSYATYISFGKKWLTFGNYKNDLIYKPLTKALGQTNEYAVEAGYAKDYYANVALFKPFSEIKHQSFPYFNLNIGKLMLTDYSRVNIGASYLNSLADSQLFQYNKGFGGFLRESIHSRVPGFATYANLTYQRWSVYITYVTALNRFRAEEVSYQYKGAEPKGLSVQTAYELMLFKLRSKFILAYDHSYQALALQLPKTRYAVGINFYPHPFLDVQLQYFKDYAYSKRSVASGLNQTVNGDSSVANTAALQVVLYLF